jgi:poly(A) polymerase
LKRRDFTVNALAWDIAAGSLVDPAGGLRDLSARVLRAVGNPKQRFAEDRGRILRAVRFGAQLGFRIERKTLAAVRSAAPKLNEIRTERGVRVRVVPSEVIARELVKALLADPVRGLDLLEGSGILSVLMPEVVAMQNVPQPRQFHAEGDVYQHTRLALSFLQSPGFRQHFVGYEPSPTLAIAVLLHDIGKPPTLKTPKEDGTDRIRFDGHDAVGAVMARKCVERLKLQNSGVDPDRVNRLVARHLIFTEKTIAALRGSKVESIFLSDPEFGKELLALKYCDGAATVNPKGKHTLNSLYLMERRIRTVAPKGKPVPKLIDGHDLIRELKIKPGPVIGRILVAIRDAQLDGTVTTRAQALLLARKLLTEA